MSGDPRPSNCKQRLLDEGAPAIPRSCPVCGLLRRCPHAGGEPAAAPAPAPPAGAAIPLEAFEQANARLAAAQAEVSRVVAALSLTEQMPRVRDALSRVGMELAAVHAVYVSLLPKAGEGG